MRRSSMTRDGPPAEVQQVTGMFLSLVDDAAPGLVEGLYLHGSLGFGEWYAGRSDIDFVAVLAERPDATRVDLLRDVHARLAETFPRPAYDGLHLTWDDLAGSPYDCPDLPCTQGGYFHDEARLDLHPVTWHELAHHGVTVRGPEPARFAIWTDQRALREYTHANLEGYWAQEVDALRRFPEEAAKPEQVAWQVLGTARLHHLLATDALTSKSGAGRYAFTAFDDRWRDIITEAMAVRLTGETSGRYDADPVRCAEDTVGFAEMVVRSGLAIPV